MTSHETIRIAHTARCKLSMAANDPNRNFRFILGHALTLDKLMLRIAEIEIDSSDSDEDGAAIEEPKGPRRVSFSAPSKARHDLVSSTRSTEDRKARRSPPPAAALPHPGEDEEDEDDGAEDDDEEEDSALSLQRFPSASGKPPRLVEDDGVEPEEGEEPVTPTDEELRVLTGGKSSEELESAYQHVAGCPCHGKHAPGGGRVWEMGGGRAVVEVVA